MRKDNSIILPRTKATLNVGDLYYINYPVEAMLTEYLITRVLRINDYFNPAFQWNKPCSWFIGDHQTMKTISQKINCDDWHKRAGKYKFCNYIRPEALMREVYECLQSHEPPLILISGFNRIMFNPAEAEREINTLLDDLRGLIRDYGCTVLLAGTSRVEDGDLNRCLPKMNFPGSLELKATASSDIPAPVGNFKVFHLPNENFVVVK